MTSPRPWTLYGGGGGHRKAHVVHDANDKEVFYVDYCSQSPGNTQSHEEFFANLELIINAVNSYKDTTAS